MSDECRDRLELAVARGADPNVGGVLFYAVQMVDTALAEWLITHGADPNREVKQGTPLFLTDIA